VKLNLLQKKQPNQRQNQKQEEVWVLKVQEESLQPKTPRARKKQRQEKEPNKEDV
jgi:hypothetical protein